MSEETTTDRLAEIEGQAEDTPATEYTPPEGWRVLAVGEVLLEGDEWVNWEGTVSRPDILHGDGTTASGGRYIRQIKPEPQPEPQLTPDDPSGPGWRDVEPDELLQDGDMLKNNTGLWLRTGVPGRLAREGYGGTYRRRIEPQPQPQPEPQPADTADELRSEIHYLQRELGEAIQGRDLFAAANREQADKIGALQGEARDLNMEIGGLQRQLAVAKEELTIAAAVSQQLQIELDAAQQVPADLPELRQLRLRLADMTLDRDTYKDAYDRIFADLCTIKETTKAETVEAIVEWLEPFRGCNSPALALLLLEALPHIMRSLTGLEQD
jgi:hypothetical protein